VRNEIDACKYLFLRELGEPEENSLRLVIEEAKASGPPEDFEAVPGKVIRGVRAIESDSTCRAFELVWPSYVAYSVRNESFCTRDKEELWEGRLICLYSNSHFLDYVMRATFASEDYPGPLRHWGVNCLNHVVDVVSTEDPRMQLLELT
jgi:hypothetical protein